MHRTKRLGLHGKFLKGLEEMYVDVDIDVDVDVDADAYVHVYSLEICPTMGDFK